MKKKKAIETLIHWIGFTLKPERTVTKEDVIRMLGMDDRYCGQNVSGRQGYRRQYYLKGTGITILTDGKRGMGICQTDYFSQIISSYFHTNILSFF